MLRLLGTAAGRLLAAETSVSGQTARAIGSYVIPDHLAVSTGPSGVSQHGWAALVGCQIEKIEPKM